LRYNIFLLYMAKNIVKKGGDPNANSSLSIILSIAVFIILILTVAGVIG